MRRRKKNSLLPKMIGIAVIVNAILLPILARFGVFKGVHGQHLEQIKLITLPPPQKRPAQKHATPKRTTPHPHTAARTAAHTQTSHESRPSPNQPKVVAAAGGTGGGGATIDNSGTGTPGALPPPPVAPPTPAPAPPAPIPVPPAPAPPPPAPAPVPAPPHVPVLVEATPIDQPHPKIPDDLSYDDIHGDFEALFTVSATGTVSVQMVSSTGNTTLDTLALDAARQWTFRPATVDGKPVDSYRRLSIEFYAA